MSFVVVGMMFAVAGAQVAVQAGNDRYPGYPSNSRPYLVKFAEDQEQEGDWREGARMRAYAKLHEGRYILFVADGALYRLDDAKQLHELEPIHASLVALGKQQAALGAVQRPLGEQQAALGAVQRGTHDPATQGNIGQVQGSVGRVQGEIGRQQGVIGRQQGILGVALYDRVQGMIDTCLHDKSCAVVEARQPV